MKRDVLAIDDDPRSGAEIRGFLEAKKRWTGDFEFRYQDQSSLLRGHCLGQFYQTPKYA